MINPFLNSGIEPLSVFMFILVQIGGRFLKFDLTKAQEKLIQNNIVQTLIFFAIVLIATRDVLTTIVIVLVTYICINILFNENHKYNVLSKKWLHEENIITLDTTTISLKDKYYNNIKNII